MSTQSEGRGGSVEHDSQEGEATQGVVGSSRSTTSGAARVERDPGTPLAGGEQHWTPAAVGSDATTQVLLSMTRWFSIGEWLRRRRNRRDDTEEPTASER